MRWRDDPASIRPMLATLAEPPLTGAGLVYEPKYDGIRGLIHVDPDGRGPRQPLVRIWSRLGNEKTSQFPSIVQALARGARRLAGPLLVDGEVVALDDRGRPAGFQRLQGRIHLTGARDVEQIDRTQPVAFIAFDLLRDGDEDLRGLPLVDRRRRLERAWHALAPGGVPGVPRVPGVPEVPVPEVSVPEVAVPEVAVPEAPVRRVPVPNAPTTRSRHVTSEPKEPEPEEPKEPQEPPEPLLRLSEQAVGDGRRLYERALNEGWEGLIAKEARAPYQSGRRSPTWRKIKVLRRQEFIVGGWTEPRQSRQYLGALLLGVLEKDGSLTYVGHTGTGFNDTELARVSKLLKPREIARSPFSERFKTNEPAHWVRPELVAEVRFTEWTDDGKLRHPVYLGLRDDKLASQIRRESSTTPNLIDQLRALEDARRDGTIELPGGERLGVTNLAKVFWPALKLTKGDLLRYYVEVSPLILPAVADRPLVMKRFPNGIDGKAFYQQQAQKENPPPGVRLETLPDDLDPIGDAGARRFVGGSLITLLYLTQIAAISQDPWFSRVQSPLDADYVAIDLDPGEGTPFARVIDVARWVRDELESLGVTGVPKTSGSRGLHVYIPLRPHTSYESGMLFCQIVATVIATRHPKVATVERTVAARRRGTVYVDYLQNIQGKTLATAYSARASAFAGVSTPLDWKEVDDTLDPRDFTIVTAPARFKTVGDLWARLRTAKPANLEAVFKKYR